MGTYGGGRPGRGAYSSGSPRSGGAATGMRPGTPRAGGPAAGQPRRDLYADRSGQIYSHQNNGWYRSDGRNWERVQPRITNPSSPQGRVQVPGRSRIGELEGNRQARIQGQQRVDQYRGMPPAQRTYSPPPRMSAPSAPRGGFSGQPRMSSPAPRGGFGGAPRVGGGTTHGGGAPRMGGGAPRGGSAPRGGGGGGRPR